jgi:hypothetical protein
MSHHYVQPCQTLPQAFGRQLISKDWSTQGPAQQGKAVRREKEFHDHTSQKRGLDSSPLWLRRGPPLQSPCRASSMRKAPSACAFKARGREGHFSRYALDYAKKVNDMTGGDLKIEVLPAGAVVPAFGLLDAVSKGTLDGGHGVLVYHYGKQTALALWGSGPGYAMDALQAVRIDRRERRFVSVRANADAAARLVQESGH